jgi:hypothetical protein
MSGEGTAHASGVGTAQVKTPSNWGRGGALRNWVVIDGSEALDFMCIPEGYAAEAWMLPVKAGSISSHELILGAAALTGSGARGRNGSTTISASATLAGTGALVVSGSATIAATGALSGTILAALLGSATISASGSLAGTSIAKGFMSATISASATLTGTRYARGFMAADIRPATQLEAAEFSAYVLDTENVETGLSVRNTLRLMAAAMAGELSGAAGTTITIRNAVADDKDRIIATVTSEGNRTAITYDLTDS